MKNKLLATLLFLSASILFSQSDKVSIVKNDSGMKLVVNGEDFMINGMNWGYVPIGTNYSYNLWAQPEDLIKSAIDTEMSLLKNMGVNAIRQYTGIPPKWVTYIYENYGIHTMINHTFGRYGLTIDGAWVSNTDYANPKVKKHLLEEATKMVNQYKDTPGVLLFLLGNENNYGLFWEGAEPENIPFEDRKSTRKARDMYKLFNEAVVKMKSLDSSHPMAICNGDLLFLDIIKEECTDIDIYGTNMYRGVSFGDAFERVKKELNLPIMFTEFGADAFNVLTNQEDQESQAYYVLGNWKEIYENAAGLGKAGNSLGGFTFQFSDGWWKFGQSKNLEIHDNNASWSNGGYTRDFKQGENNMNEEWFGICAKGETNERGLFTEYPRAAYYAIKEAHQLNPYEKDVTLEFVNQHFSSISIMDAVLRARGDKATLSGAQGGKIRISKLEAKFTTFNTGGSLITTPDEEIEGENNYPNELGFDHMQSYFVGIEATPTPNMRANVNFNILGNVASNPINEIFYENRGRTITVETEDGSTIDINDNNRVQVYNAEFEWNGKIADVRGFYRTGHYHWGYEGDFFGLYPEAHYGENLDIYQGEISGLEIDGKGIFKGLKAAFGPQLWWGANPALLLKYQTNIKGYNVTGIFHEDIDNAESGVSSIAIPMPKTRRLTLHAKKQFGRFGIEVGGIWAGQPLNGREFQIYHEDTDLVVVDKINSKDNWGGRAKVTFQKGRFNWYAQGAAQGLVANGGGDNTKTFTGWRLKDTGSGNQTNFLTGFTYSFGNLQIAPNFLWQKPIVEAMPNGVEAPGRLRNIQDDPFAVRANRETTAGEILFTYDPTPGTWMYEWDNDRAEDAKLAVSAGFVYRHLPTTMDAAIGFNADRSSFAFGSSVPAEDLWESHARIVSKLSPNLGIIGNFYYGNGQANGDSERVIKRFGGDVRLLYNKLKINTHVKVNDWGPYDYHRDYNLTYPLQLMLDISTTLGKPDWFILPSTTIGIRGTWRSLDQYSPRYSPLEAPEFGDPYISTVGFDNGNEWEIRTYVHINIGK